MNPKERLIVALDVPSFDEAVNLVEKLGDAVEVYKVGSQLFTGYGPFIVRTLQARGKKVFFDLKFHDIPNTVANGVAAAVDLNVPVHKVFGTDVGRTGGLAPVFMLTVHTQGGREMMKAAADAARKRAAEKNVLRPYVVGVTVLTSDAPADNMSEIVLSRAVCAKESGLDGVVASGREAMLLRREFGKDFLIVVPGIRPPGFAAGDQKRIETPSSAIQNGADYLVVGRPVVQSADPRQAALDILSGLESVL